LSAFDRASTPAPSQAALGWLETSIRACAKYIDSVGKALKDEDNKKEMVNRERLRSKKFVHWWLRCGRVVRGVYAGPWQFG